MASSSGTYREASNNNNNNHNHQGHVSGSYNGSSVPGEWGMPTFLYQQTISLDWTPEEQALLEEGLCKYSSESSIIRYAKIALRLKNKTVRDVALRCKWITRKEIIKRRKDDFNARKNKDKNEKVNDSLAMPSRFAIQSGLSHALGVVSNCNDDIISYNDVGEATRRLLQHNAWVFKQISTNLSTHQDSTGLLSHSVDFLIRENVCLLTQAQDNIFKILTNLNDMGPTMKKMAPLPKMNEELANSILPPTAFQR